MSYADDVNHIVVTNGTSKKEHARICDQVNECLDKFIQEDNLSWDAQKESRITFGDGR